MITKFNEKVFVKNIKTSTKALMALVNKVPSCSVLDDVRSITKTDIFISDYSKKIYGVKFFENIKKYVREYGKLHNHSEIRISNFCFIKMKDKDQVNYHSSFESNFVGIYLLESSEKKHCVYFYDNDKNKDVKINMNKGDLVLFPSHLLRKFPDIKSKKQYTYIIFDFHLDRPRIYGKK